MVLEEIQSWNDAKVAPAGGKYYIVEQYRNEYDDQDYIWTTRLNKDQLTIEDQMFEFKEMKNWCVIKGHSRS